MSKNYNASGNITGSFQPPRETSIVRKSISLAVLALIVLQNLLILSPVTTRAAVSTDVVISQVYGGGGNAGALYTNDFIELFNRGTAPISLNGWSVQYASATGTSWQVTNLTNVTVQPGKYYLVQEAVGAGGTQALPTPDATGTINMSGTAGKVALVTNQIALTCGGTATACSAVATIKDFVGFGATATTYEGSGPTATLTNTTAAFRGGNGCSDTDNNAADFTTAAPNPRNTSSPASACSGGSTNPSGTGTATPNSVLPGGMTLLTVTVTPGTGPSSTGLVVTANLTGIGGAAAQNLFDDGTNGDVTAGDNIFSYHATVAAATTVGGKTLSVTITDAQSRTGSASISLTVTSSSAPPTATGSANPATLLAGASTLLTVTVTPGSNPASTGIAVTGNLTSIGGSATQMFFDDGTNGDATAGDNVFSYLALVAAGTGPGVKTLSVTVTDAQSRTANANISLTITAPASPAQPLPFTQNWSNTALITVDNDWSGVPGIVGYRGDDLTTATGTDPQTILADGASTPVNVIANQTTPDTITSGGVYEFELANPVVAFQGSGTADAPHIVISLDTTGQNNVTVFYNLRDIDGSADNAVQPVALQYRVGNTGNYTNVPAAFVADATTGPNEATKVTPVAVVLPAAVNNQPLVQLRIITANAVGSDEFVGIDDINVVSNGTLPLSASGSATPNQVAAGTSTLLTVTVTPGSNPASTGIAVTGNLTSIGGSATQMFFDDGTNGDATAGDNVFSYLATVAANNPGGSQNIPVTVTDAQSRTAQTTISFTTFAAADPQEHLLMGNPTNAVTDVNQPFNYLLSKPQYAVSYHRDRAIPNWVSWHLDASWLGTAPRQDDFRPDDTLPADWYHVTQFDYLGSGFDRGHHTPSADRTRSIPDNSATFLMTNMMPQAPGNNQGPWEQLESFGRTLVGQGNELYILAAGTGTGGVGSAGGVTNTLAGGKITVPSYTWKVILVLPNGSNDVSRVDANTRTIAVIMPNNDAIRPDPWQKYLATVDQVEALTGYDFFSNVPANIQAVIESRLDAASNTSPQTVAAGTYTNLDITSPNTTLGGNVTVTGTLSLGGSILTTGINKVILGPNATVTRISGYVNGTVEKQFAAPQTFEFPVGTANGYSPVTANVTAVGQNPSSLTVKAIQSVHPNAPDPNTALKRYWMISETGDLTANLTFKYLDADVPAGVPDETAFKVQRFLGTGFTQIPSTVNAAANTATTTTAISDFSDLTLFTAPFAPSGRVKFDFDGDGKADVSLFRPSSGTWFLLGSQNGFSAAQFGNTGDKIVPADYDGDGRTDLAVFRGGIWYLQRSTAGFTGIQFGEDGDIPQPADFDGDGKADLAVFRPSTASWYVLNLVTNQPTAFQFGQSSDKPVVGDYDGDGRADYAVFRPSTGVWYIQQSTAGFTGAQFGESGDRLVPADYDGDGRTDLAVFRPSTATWYLQRSTAGFTGIQFGISTDVPAPADYDGDGKTDLAVFRNGIWYLQRSTAGFTGVQFGEASDLPAPNAFVQ